MSRYEESIYIFFIVLPWSYIRWCTGSVGSIVYFFMTLSSISAEPRNNEKHPGLQRTHPRTCSVAFWSQWAMAYSNFWNHTMGPANRRRPFESCCEFMVLFVLRKFILQTRMRSYSVGLDVWYLFGHFIYFHTSCVRTAKALARLRGYWSPMSKLAALIWQREDE